MKDQEERDEVEDQEYRDMQEELYYDQDEVIAGEVFQDKYDMYRREH